MTYHSGCFGKNVFKSGLKVEREKPVNRLLKHFRGMLEAWPRMTAVEMVGRCRLEIHFGGRRYRSSWEFGFGIKERGSSITSRFLDGTTSWMVLSITELGRQKLLLLFKAQLSSHLLHEVRHQLQHDFPAFLWTTWEIIALPLILWGVS